MKRGWWFLFAVVGINFAAAGWTALCTDPGIPWNHARLASAFAVAHGLSLYVGQGSAATLGWMYGPGFALWYWPITRVGNPTLALALASLINLVTALVPFLLVLRVAFRGWSRPVWLAAGVGLGLFLGTESFRESLYFIRVDVVSVALGIFSCLSLYQATQTGRRAWLHAGGLLLVAAIWTKQLEVGLIPGLVIWLWKADRRRWLGPFLGWSLGYGLVLSLAVVVRYGFEPVYFSLVYFPGLNPFQDRSWLLARSVGEWLEDGAACLVVAALVGWGRKAQGMLSRVGMTAPALVSLLGWTALTQFPLDLAALCKRGGLINSLHANAYLLAILLICVGELFLVAFLSGCRAGRFLGPVLAVVIVAAVVLGDLAALRQPVEWRLFRGEEASLAQARAHPHGIYFPWDPLVTIVSDNRIYPFDDALLSLAYAGLAPSPAAVRAAIPRHALIVDEDNAQSHFIVKYIWSDLPAPKQ